MLKNDKGLDGFTLKWIALILMVLDHVHYMFWDTPIILTQLGRLSAPIFIYITARSMGYTKRPKRFMLRLYVASVGMAIGNSVVNAYLPHPEGAIIFNNIFSTLFLITYLIYFGGCLKNAIKVKAVKSILKNTLILAIPLLGTVVTFWALNAGNVNVLKLVMTFLPSLVTVEGGVLWVIMGIGFYLVRNSKKNTAIFYTIFSGFVFFIISNGDYTFENLFLINFQWLMVFALPLILSYNGKKGHGWQHFFYVFYPAHIYGLLILSRLIAL